MRSLRVQEVSTSRGMITDRSGRPLAVSVPVKAIWADPKELHDAGGITLDNRWKALSDALKMPLDQLASRVNANPKGRFIYLARQVNPDMADYIRKLKLPGIHLREESRRYYPSGEVTAHLIGFTNVDSQGIEGVEKASISGSPASRASALCVKTAMGASSKIFPLRTAGRHTTGTEYRRALAGAGLSRAEQRRSVQQSGVWQCRAG